MLFRAALHAQVCAVWVVVGEEPGSRPAWVFAPAGLAPWPSGGCSRSPGTLGRPHGSDPALRDRLAKAIAEWGQTRPILATVALKFPVPGVVPGRRPIGSVRREDSLPAGAG